MSKLWGGCLSCQDKSCCKLDIAYPLFVTQEEMRRIANLCPNKAELFNRALPCPFLMENSLCMIHEDKPIDCRFFPFDVIKMSGRFHWVVWKIDCLVLQDEPRFEEYLMDMERRLLSGFAAHLDDYSSFRIDELFSKYDYEVLREVQLRQGFDKKTEAPS